MKTGLVSLIRLANKVTREPPVDMSTTSLKIKSSDDHHALVFIPALIYQTVPLVNSFI